LACLQQPPTPNPSPRGGGESARLFPPHEGEGRDAADWTR
jgi:hypothetical protein